MKKRKKDMKTVTLLSKKIERNSKPMKAEKQSIFIHQSKCYTSFKLGLSQNFFIRLEENEGESHSFRLISFFFSILDTFSFFSIGFFKSKLGQLREKRINMILSKFD